MNVSLGQATVLGDSDQPPVFMIEVLYGNEVVMDASATSHKVLGESAHVSPLYHFTVEATEQR